MKDGEVDAMLSARTTGALLAGFFIVGRIKGVERPGLISTLPTVDGRGYDMLGWVLMRKIHRSTLHQLCCDGVLLC